MNGRVDFLDWTIKPDQMQMLGPLFGIIVLVFLDVVFYPMFAAIGIRKPLQRLTFCGGLAVIAFSIASLLQFKIVVRLKLRHLTFIIYSLLIGFFLLKGNITEIKSGQGHINIYNGFDCNVFLRSKSLQVQEYIGPLEMFHVSHTVVSQNVIEEDVVEITLGFESNCNFVPKNYELNTTVTIIEGQVNI